MFPINVVEKESGVSKYLLRMWERRYSFPRPSRDAKGERLYSPGDIEKLKLVKSLMKTGYRPSKIMNKSIGELKDLHLTFSEASPHSVEILPVVIVLLTEPSLESHLHLALRNHHVKKVLRLSSAEQIENLEL